MVNINETDTDANSNIDALEILRQTTKKEVIDLLTNFKKAAVIRCTGFGKTWLLSEMTTLYNKILYIYPAKCIMTTVKERRSTIDLDQRLADASDDDECEEIAKQELQMLSEKKLNFKNIDFMTYAKLARLSEDNIKDLPDYNLIIFDECHRCGAPLAKINVRNLMDIKSDSCFLGATATPSRSDAFDVIEEFFTDTTITDEGDIIRESRVTSEYTLHDAFQDNIIKKPYYCFMTSNIETDLREEALTAGEDLNDIRVKTVLKKGLIEISKLYNIPSIIKDMTAKYAHDQSYMKYIVFFSSFQQLDKKLPEVEEWFTTAFPMHILNSIIVTSRSKDEAENIDIIDQLPYWDHHIDLIACVDMLNLGAHINNLTGIVMYRCTSSSTIYIQELGRALSTGNDYPSLVFDIVDNIHRKSIFDLSIQGQRRPRAVISTNDISKDDILISIDITNNTDDEVEQIKTKYQNKIVDVQTDDKNRTFIIMRQKKQGWHSLNDIQPEDIYMTGYEALYRELLAKVVAEPQVEKIKRVQEEHYKLWCKINNMPYPATRKEMEKHLNTMPPLPIICKWQNVAIRYYLDYIYPADNNFQLRPMADTTDKSA